MKYLCFLSLCLGLLSLSFTAPQASLSGLVTGPDGKPLAGATVSVVKTKKTTISNKQGKYALSIDAGTYEIECSAKGYISKRVVEVVLKSGKKQTLNFSLEKGSALTERIVTDLKDETAPVTSTKSKPGASASGRLTKKSAGESAKYKELSSERLASKPAPSRAKDADKSRDVLYARPETVDYLSAKTEGIRSDDRAPIEAESAPVTPPSGPGTPKAPHAGLLTAGEWNDLHNWNHHWVDLLNDGEIASYEKMYGFYPKYRYTVMLSNDQDFPVVDAPVKLLTLSGELLWETRTDNNGKAELWAGIFDQKEPGELRAEALVNGLVRDLGKLKPAKDGINRQQINVECKAPKNVDIVWAVDATGSMGDEIEYLKTELLDVIGRAKSRNPALAFRMGTVFYRDRGDDYITKSSGLSADVNETVEFIRKQYAGGGGDYPEAVHSALEEAIFNQKWQKDAVARICFLVLDASPHQDPEVNASLQRSIREAARLGIRIVPVTASGIQKDTEFLMKFFGVATNGSYVFLTDHSGIGEKHLEPTTEEYKVELLNDLLVRLITEYTHVKTCEGQSTIRFDDPQQQQNPGPMPEARYYPNPAGQQFTLDLPFDVESVAIFDSEGKLARKLETLKAGLTVIPVNDLPEGFYTIRILKANQVQTGKLMIVRS